jgi:hypothetical protein
MSSKKAFWTAMVAACMLAFANVWAQVPQVINYQGQLTDASGNPTNGTFTMIFKIFDAASGGTQLYTETQSVTVSSGVFNVLIGSVTPVPLNLFDSGTERHLEVTVNGTVLTPRRQFGSVPYAFRTRGSSGGGWTDDGSVVRLTTNTDNVGIGTTSPVTATGGRVLHIDNPSGASALRLGDGATNGQQWEWQSTVIGSNGAMNLSNVSNSTNPFTVLENGNVGVGTTTPGFLLTLPMWEGIRSLFGVNLALIMDLAFKAACCKFTPISPLPTLLLDTEAAALLPKECASKATATSALGRRVHNRSCMSQEVSYEWMARATNRLILAVTVLEATFRLAVLMQAYPMSPCIMQPRMRT